MVPFLAETYVFSSFGLSTRGIIFGALSFWMLNFSQSVLGSNDLTSSATHPLLSKTAGIQSMCIYTGAGSKIDVSAVDPSGIVV